MILPIARYNERSLECQLEHNIETGLCATSSYFNKLSHCAHITNCSVVNLNSEQAYSSTKEKYAFNSHDIVIVSFQQVDCKTWKMDFLALLDCTNKIDLVAVQLHFSYGDFEVFNYLTKILAVSGNKLKCNAIQLRQIEGQYLLQAL